MGNLKKNEISQSSLKTTVHPDIFDWYPLEFVHVGMSDFKDTKPCALFAISKEFRPRLQILQIDVGNGRNSKWKTSRIEKEIR